MSDPGRLPLTLGRRVLGLRTFTSLRNHRDYRLYFASSGVSFVGTWMQQIAAYWLVLELTGSAVAVGALALVQTLPITVLALVGGAIAERVDLRQLLIATQCSLAAGAAILAVLAAGGWVQVWHVYLLGIAQGIAVALDGPARHSLVFRIVGTDDLPNAIALSSGLGTTARVLGPALGGLVVAAAGPAVAFALNAISYGFVVAAVRAMHVSATPLQKDPPPLVAGVVESLRFAGSSPRVAVTVCNVLLVSTFAFNFDVVLPLIAKLTLAEGAEVFGLIASVFGAGALCGALILATIGKARVLLVVLGAAGFGSMQLLLAQQNTVARVCATLFAAGIFYILWGASALATLQLAAPEHLRARAASLYFFAFLGGAPLGGIVAASLTEVGGTELALTVAGSIAVLVAVTSAGVLRLTARARPAPVPQELL